MELINCSSTKHGHTMLKNFTIFFVLFFSAVTRTVFAASCMGSPAQVSDGRTLSSREFMDNLSNTSVLALGERHGVIAHPQVVACLLRELSPEYGSTLVVEHLLSADQKKVDVYRDIHPEDVGGLGKELRWWESGWPAWKIYEPLFQAAWSSRTLIYGADIPRTMSRVSVDELEKKFGIEKTAFVRREWASVMREAHCNMLDEERASSFGDQQITRDAAMASVVEKASLTGTTVIFYAGRSHIRKDLAVPVHLANGTSPRVLSISLQETHIAGKPVDKQKILEEARGRYDYVWFVGEVKNDTICEKLK